jgi:uncharacterized protein
MFILNRTTDRRAAPISAASGPARPLGSFVSATVSFVCPKWTYRYDQAGIALCFTKTGEAPLPSGQPHRWLKTGVEFYLGRPQLSTVACDSWADWSVMPLPTNVGEGDTVEILVEREGPSIWVYYVPKEGDKVPLREVTWVFGDAKGDIDGWTISVGEYVARPEKDVKTEGEELVVEFGPLNITWR